MFEPSDNYFQMFILMVGMHTHSLSCSTLQYSAVTHRIYNTKGWNPDGESLCLMRLHRAWWGFTSMYPTCRYSANELGLCEKDYVLRGESNNSSSWMLLLNNFMDVLVSLLVPNCSRHLILIKSSFAQTCIHSVKSQPAFTVVPDIRDGVTQNN